MADIDSTSAAERRDAVLALPLRPEPLTDEEEAIFREIEAEVLGELRSITTLDVVRDRGKNTAKVDQ